MEERQKFIVELPKLKLNTLAKEAINQGKSRKAYIEKVLTEKADKLNEK